MLTEYTAILERDPAATRSEALLMPGLYALIIHRHLSHPLYLHRMRFVARAVSQIMRFTTGIEIHPGAKIGEGAIIDHGMGVVIGETAEIGDNVTMFHGVTLGGTGKQKGKRHPTVGNNVFIGTCATLLGNITIGDNVIIGAQTVVSGKDVPPDVTVVGNPPMIIRENGVKVKKEL